MNRHLLGIFLMSFASQFAWGGLFSCPKENQNVTSQDCVEDTSTKLTPPGLENALFDPKNPEQFANQVFGKALLDEMIQFRARQLVHFLEGAGRYKKEMKTLQLPVNPEVETELEKVGKDIVVPYHVTPDRINQRVQEIFPFTRSLLERQEQATLKLGYGQAFQPKQPINEASLKNSIADAKYELSKRMSRLLEPNDQDPMGLEALYLQSGPVMARIRGEYPRKISDSNSVMNLTSFEWGGDVGWDSVSDVQIRSPSTSTSTSEEEELRFGLKKEVGMKLTEDLNQMVKLRADLKKSEDSSLDFNSLVQMNPKIAVTLICQHPSLSIENRNLLLKTLEKNYKAFEIQTESPTHLTDFQKHLIWTFCKPSKSGQFDDPVLAKYLLTHQYQSAIWHLREKRPKDAEKLEAQILSELSAELKGRSQKFTMKEVGTGASKPMQVIFPSGIKGLFKPDSSATSRKGQIGSEDNPKGEFAAGEMARVMGNLTKPYMIRGKLNIRGKIEEGSFQLWVDQTIPQGKLEPRPEDPSRLTSKSILDKLKQTFKKLDSNNGLNERQRQAEKDKEELKHFTEYPNGLRIHDALTGNDDRHALNVLRKIENPLFYVPIDEGKAFNLRSVKQTLLLVDSRASLKDLVPTDADFQGILKLEIYLKKNRRPWELNSNPELNECHYQLLDEKIVCFKNLYKYKSDPNKIDFSKKGNPCQNLVDKIYEIQKIPACKDPGLSPKPTG